MAIQPGSGQLPAPVMAGMLKISVPGWPISGGGTRCVRPEGPQALGNHLLLLAYLVWAKHTTWKLVQCRRI